MFSEASMFVMKWNR